MFEEKVGPGRVLSIRSSILRGEIGLAKDASITLYDTRGDATRVAGPDDLMKEVSMMDNGASGITREGLGLERPETLTSWDVEEVAGFGRFRFRMHLTVPTSTKKSCLEE